jgi:glutaconate CoA-transferase subunit A
LKSKRMSLRDAVAEFVGDGCSVAMGLQHEHMIPFAAGHEIIRQHKRDLTLIGSISDILFDQLVAAGCVRHIITAWVGNVMMGLAYNFRRAVEQGAIQITNMSNFTTALALQAAAQGVPFLPARTALGSDIPHSDLFKVIESPFTDEELGVDGASRSAHAGTRQKLLAVRALAPDVTIVHVQRADAQGNAHCWGSLGIMIEASRAARHLIVVAEEIVPTQVITSDPNRTVIPGFLVSAVVECPLGAHPSPVQGHYRRDDEFFASYHRETKTQAESNAWLARWVHGVQDRAEYLQLLGKERVESLQTRQHAYAAPTDYGY